MRVAASLGGFALFVTAMVFLFQSHKARILAEVANAKIVETDPGASVLNSASSRVFRRAYKAVR